MASICDLSRLLRALRFSYDGMQAAWKRDAAFRQELIAAAILIPLSLCFEVSRIEHLLLIVSLLWMICVELLNTAVEFTVDRISLEIHPFAKHAKDAASAAVLMSFLMALITWLVILL